MVPLDASSTYLFYQPQKSIFVHNAFPFSLHFSFLLEIGMHFFLPLIHGFISFVVFILSYVFPRSPVWNYIITYRPSVIMCGQNIMTKGWLIMCVHLLPIVWSSSMCFFSYFLLIFNSALWLVIIIHFDINFWNFVVNFFNCRP